MMPLDFSLPTALVLIDNQAAFTHPTYWGTSRSNPHFEENLTALLSAFRTARATSPAGSHIEIIHVFHSSTSTTSLLHYKHPEHYIRPLDFAVPASDGTEPVFWKCVNSAFVGTELEPYLRSKGIRQIFFTGLTTDHCVSTTVRMAANLGVVDRYPEGPVKVNRDGSQEQVPVDHGRIVLVADATAVWAKAGFDAETVHGVSVASLDGEFADVLKTAEVVEALKKL